MYNKVHLCEHGAKSHIHTTNPKLWFPLTGCIKILWVLVEHLVITLFISPHLALFMSFPKYVLNFSLKSLLLSVILDFNLCDMTHLIDVGH